MPKRNAVRKEKAVIITDEFFSGARKYVNSVAKEGKPADWCPYAREIGKYLFMQSENKRISRYEEKGSIYCLKTNDTCTICTDAIYPKLESIEIKCAGGRKLKLVPKP